MRESSTYQAILEEGVEKGRVEGAATSLQQTLLDLGARLIGSPTKKVQTAIANINDVERLQRMTRRILDIASWQELLNTP